MSKTELLNPIAKYYIIDSQSGYKQNVSLEQNRIQKLEKLFSRAETAMLCPASGARGGSSPLVPLSLTRPLPPPPSAHPPMCHPRCARQAAGRAAGGAACTSRWGPWVILLPRAGEWLSWLLRKVCCSLLPRPPLPWAGLMGAVGAAAAGRAQGLTWGQGPFSAAHRISAGYPGLRRLPPSVQLSGISIILS